MADETPPPPGAPGPPDRRRPAPTIDLKATEIASEPVAAGAAAGPESPPDPDGAARMPPKSDLHRSLSALAATVSWPLVGAGFAGAILTLGVVWVVASSSSRGNDLSLAQARIAQLERQVADLAGRAAANVENSASVGDLATRLQKLEAEQSRVAAARPPAPDLSQASRIAALEAELKSLGETLGALNQRSERSAAANAAALNELSQKLARPDASEAQSNAASNATSGATASEAAALIAALANRVDAIESSAKEISKTMESTLAAALARRNADIADDRAVRTAVIASALAAAVESGEPFAAALKAAQAQGPDATALAPLEGFAASGVPGAGALARELSSLEPALLQAAGAAPAQGGFLEKLQANAERLVRIRPIEEVAGDDPAAVIARAEIKAVRGDVPGALAELGTLPANVRAPAQAWIAKAQARAAALAASRAFAADALAALARPPR
jgi:hypothetical protein